MFDERLKELNRENLCTHFILPLLRMNKGSFTKVNFVNSYLTHSAEIVVKVVDKHFVHGKYSLLHPQFKRILKDELYYYYVYNIPDNWKADLNLFIQGKFSEFSELAKETIRVQSGLPLNATNISKVPETDIRLLALEKHPVLQRWWQDLLGLGEPLSGELLSIPLHSSFIDLSILHFEEGERLSKPLQL